MPTEDIDGIMTRYEVVGSGPPLLMFSPGGFDATMGKWRTLGAYNRTKILDHLSQRYACIMFDRREAGESGGRVERISWEHYARQGRGLLERLNIERAHVMGGCMGCSPAMAFGIAHPETTLSLVLYWPVGGAKYRIKRQPPIRPAPGLRSARGPGGCRLPGFRRGQDLWDRPARRPLGRRYRPRPSLR